MQSSYKISGLTSLQFPVSHIIHGRWLQGLSASGISRSHSSWVAALHIILRVCTPEPQLTEHSVQLPKLHVVHSCVRHCWTLGGFVSSGQGFIGSLQVMLRYCVPSPQLTEHSDHVLADHCGQSRIRQISLCFGRVDVVQDVKEHTTFRSLIPSPQDAEQELHSLTAQPEHRYLKNNNV